MPLTLPNGSSYKLCLLDTNALSEMVKYPTNEGRGYIERFPPTEFVPCFTPYNLFELRRDSAVFTKFLDFFRIYPSLLTHPFQLILKAEIGAIGRAAVTDVLFNAFTPMGPNSSYDFAQFIDKLFAEPAMQLLETEWRTRDQNTLDTWQRNKENFTPTKAVPNAQDAKQFVHDACIDTLCQIHPQFVKACLDNNNVSVLQSLPSVQIMLYSQYYRIFDSNWAANDQEATDVCITAAAPYVDAVVTEKLQAEIYNKAQKHVTGMSIDVAKLKDIRHHS